MRTPYTALVGLTVAAHFAFLIYLPIGGFLALRWRRSIWVHVAVVLWGLGSVALHLWCPLTALEQWARPRAGMAPLGSAGFIDHSGRINEYRLTDGTMVKSPVHRPHSCYLMEAFKLKDASIEQIEADFVTVPYAMPSPWDDWTHRP